MNPELPQVRSNSETMPQIPGSAEYFPDGQVRSPEIAPASLEQQQPPQEEKLAPSTQPLAYVPITSPYPAVPAAPAQQPASTVISDDTPSLAADDDLIEKEWVDKVKKIIALTRGKPYEQAQAVAALQADYLKKRYNRTLGESGGQNY